MGARDNPDHYLTGINNVGPGWHPLIDELEADLRAAVGDTWAVSQVKEKFGGLRYYIDIQGDQAAWDRANAAVTAAEGKSFTICETCGSTEGVTTEGPWLVTLCSTHRAQRGA